MKREKHPIRIPRPFPPRPFVPQAMRDWLHSPAGKSALEKALAEAKEREAPPRPCGQPFPCTVYG